MLCDAENVAARDNDMIPVTDDEPLARGEELARRLPLDDALARGLLLELGELLGEPDADLDTALLRDAATLVDTLTELLADAALHAEWSDAELDAARGVIRFQHDEALSQPQL